MTIQNPGSRLAKSLAAISVAVLLSLTAACGGGGHPRGQFAGFVTDKTEADVTGKVGKPDAVDSANPNIVKWTYKGKTFDPDNNNKTDKEAVLILTRDKATGKLKVTDVIFNS